ncbi:hypothetical protein EDB80DRAFT_700466 [Ilyonectria destructans]|nr:hypothetical protein EDB80DRAFT_700466 [Ilyonectria destructans]
MLLHIPWVHSSVTSRSSGGSIQMSRTFQLTLTTPNPYQDNPPASTRYQRRILVSDVSNQATFPSGSREDIPYSEREWRQDKQRQGLETTPQRGRTTGSEVGAEVVEDTQERAGTARATEGERAAAVGGAATVGVEKEKAPEAKVSSMSFSVNGPGAINFQVPGGQSLTAKANSSRVNSPPGRPGPCLEAIYRSSRARVLSMLGAGGTGFGVDGLAGGASLMRAAGSWSVNSPPGRAGPELDAGHCCWRAKRSSSLRLLAG